MEITIEEPNDQSIYLPTKALSPNKENIFPLNSPPVYYSCNICELGDVCKWKHRFRHLQRCEKQMANGTFNKGENNNCCF